jgi:hypothetical protein
MNKLIKFKPEETKAVAFEVAETLLHAEGRSVQDTVKALVMIGCSELYAKSVVVHVKTKFYLH